MRVKRPDTREKADVSLSPLIDAVFLLLIFFLVATMMKEEQKDIAIDLPEAEAAVKLPPADEQVVIGIDPEGRFYYDGEPSTVDHLIHRLGRVAAEAPDRRIRLDVDRDAPVHAIVEVMHACQFRGLANVGIRTYDRYYNR